MTIIPEAYGKFRINPGFIAKVVFVIIILFHLQQNLNIPDFILRRVTTM